MNAGAIGRTHVGKVAAVVRPRPGGGAVAALEHGFALIDGEFSELHTLPRIVLDETIRLNDGGCDPARQPLLRIDGIRREGWRGDSLPARH